MSKTKYVSINEVIYKATEVDRLSCKCVLNETQSQKILKDALLIAAELEEKHLNKHYVSKELSKDTQYSFMTPRYDYIIFSCIETKHTINNHS